MGELLAGAGLFLTNLFTALGLKGATNANRIQIEALEKRIKDHKSHISSINDKLAEQEKKLAKIDNIEQDLAEAMKQIEALQAIIEK